MVRNKRQFVSEDLLIASPDSDAAQLDSILVPRGSRITLIVLPKWRTEADPEHPGWVRSNGLHLREIPEGVLGPQWKLDVARHKSARERLTAHGPAVSPDIGFAAPRITQTISGKGLVPVLTDAQGRIVLGQFGNRPLYLLADPDLLSNRGMADRGQAAAAWRCSISSTRPAPTIVVFDVTLNGLGQSRSPLRLVVRSALPGGDPELVAALLLAGVQAIVALRRAAPPPTGDRLRQGGADRQ